MHNMGSNMDSQKGSRPTVKGKAVGPYKSETAEVRKIAENNHLIVASCTRVNLQEMSNFH